MEQLELYVPKLEDLWFYQKITGIPAVSIIPMRFCLHGMRIW